VLPDREAARHLPPGINGAPIPKIGYFGWKTFELAFDECRLPGSMR
jgi:hypothetical protein